VLAERLAGASGSAEVCLLYSQWPHSGIDLCLRVSPYFMPTSCKNRGVVGGRLGGYAALCVVLRHTGSEKPGDC
jgi:hypothetical protein